MSDAGRADRQEPDLLGDPSLAALRQRTSTKWRTYPDDVLPSFVAEMDFDLARPIIDAVAESMAAGDAGYGHIGRLGEAFAGFAASRLGWSPDPARIFAIPDVMTGISEMITALTPPGSGVVISPPVYAPFFFRIRFTGRQVVEAPLRRRGDGGYELDAEALDRALSRDGVSAYVLCSPHNPVGRVWTAQELTMVADICHARGVLVLADEIHAPLVLPGAAQVPFLSLSHPATARAIAFTSASKGWNIPGLKCGLAIAGSPELATALTERWEVLTPGLLGVHAAVAAFERATGWLDAVLAQLDRNRGLLATLLAEHLPQIRYRPPEASFLAWLDCRELDGAPGGAAGDWDDPAAGFLERGRVALASGTDFGAQGRGFARLNMGTTEPLLAEAVRRMTAAVG
jgi:cystathionine beta-lyase